MTSHNDQSSPMTFTAAPALSGSVAVPGDKSISHRSLMLSALAVGESRVEGLAVQAADAKVHRGSPSEGGRHYRRPSLWSLSGSCESRHRDHGDG